METQNSGCIGPSISVRIPSIKDNLQALMTAPVANDTDVIFPLEM